MKSYILSLVILSAIGLGLARGFTGFMNKVPVDKKQLQVACLTKNGLNNSTDLQHMREFLRRNVIEQREFHLEKQFSCALACIFNITRSTQISIYQKLAEIIEYDDQSPIDLRRDMKYRLEKCRRAAGGDDCKLLSCIKIFRSPFKQTLKI